MDFGKLDFKSQNVYLLKSNFKVTVLYSSELLNLFIKANVEIFLLIFCEFTFLRFFGISKFDCGFLATVRKEEAPSVREILA